MAFKFSIEDIQQIHAQGLTEESAQYQIERLRAGYSPVRLHRPCVIGDGILQIPAEAFNLYLGLHGLAARQGRLMKFVPASGAASRMFEQLSAILNRGDFLSDSDSYESLPENLRSFCQEFTDNVSHFPFYEMLNESIEMDGRSLRKLCNNREYRLIFEKILKPAGLGYERLPKGLIPFHHYSDHVRTPFEEHLVEAVDYCADEQGVAHVHFTLAEADLAMVQDYINRVKSRYEKDSAHLDISYSIQQSATDALALDSEGVPFRNEDGSLFFRPGGHGALLRNLNELNGDVVFIKNIDNVAPAWFDSQTTLYKQLLCGILVDLQQRIFTHLQALESPNPDACLLDDIDNFISERLGRVWLRQGRELTLEDKKLFLIDALNKPLRVCGMVRNQGEPGGGPYWVEHPDRSLSFQIVEKDQINQADPDQLRIFQEATHFNPVDLVCGLRNYRGEQFDLQRFSDPETGLTSNKSKQGRILKALEHPGLWNGGMAHWNTIFVEVPLRTFNPVKTVVDLLRPEHQPQSSLCHRHLKP